MESMLTLQTTGGADVTMSSREIADLVEKRHDNVLRTIESLLARGTIALPQFEEVPNDGPGPKMIRQYRVGKRDSYVIVAQLSPEFTARLVDRWQELEAAAPAPAVPQSFAAALRLAAEQQDLIDFQATQLAAAAPAVEFVERYADSTGTKGFRQVAKLLGAKENLFREFLIDQKILYRLGAELTPHAQHIDAGRFCVKAGTAESGHAFNSARFTPKGVTWIAGEWAKHQVALRQKGGQHAA
ncbi:phage antirepressor KilAC domain-containing protein [Telluria beijingensis]|uniref:phage antirepressor KilAC domain-containing protein n=1 Tax=Telluria beijingensis TaxID=3068633 RepID=UPI00279552BF|nr:phage antirepressor KilAC domain-containing protein [Massilia sp. REN29]